MKLNNWQDWFKLVMILIILIFTSIGFLTGYLYGDKSAIEDPFTYGIKKLNEINNDKFTCSCISESGKINPFLFDENGTKTDFLPANDYSLVFNKK